MRRFLALAMMASVLPSLAQAQESRKFTVHFDENQTTLSGQDQAVLGGAIEMAQDCVKASVSLVGHDDASHPAQKAEEIATARAETVRKTMIDAGGINADFKTEARGRRDLAVQTADGVRERQNRSVEISVACK